jgi:hypothetical protein
MQRQGPAATAAAPQQSQQPGEKTCWRFTAAQLEATPSRLDGIPYEDEQRLRLAGCAHILETVRLVLEYASRASAPAMRAPPRVTEKRMRLPCSTACVLFNRFFTRQSFARHDRFVRGVGGPPPAARTTPRQPLGPASPAQPFLRRSHPARHTHTCCLAPTNQPGLPLPPLLPSAQLVATACAFLAFKVEEAHQKLYKVVSCARDAWYAARSPAVPLLTPAQEVALHQSVLEAERCVMYTLEFDVGVVHPYAFLGAHLKCWKKAGVFEPGWVRSAKNCDAPREVEEALALGSNLAFQALASALPLRFSPQDLAAATLSLAFDILYARRGGAGSSSSGGGGGGGAPPQQRFAPSPIKASHFALCSGVSGLESICELRAAIPACLGMYAVGDSAVRLFLGLSGGVAPVAAQHTVEGAAGAGSSGRGAAHHPAPPLLALSAAGLAAAASSRLLGHLAASGGGGGADGEEAPQLAPTEEA